MLFLRPGAKRVASRLARAPLRKRLAASGQQVATPTFTPDGNLYNLEQLVRVDCATVGATINYTTTGVDPTPSDRSVASGASIVVDRPLILKARAFKSGMTASVVKAANYDIVGKIAAGQNHSLAVKTDGTLLAWGKNANGQLGSGSTSTGASSAPWGVKQTSTTFLTGVVTAAGGGSHSVALKSDGTVRAWGLNASGQLGDGTLTQRLYPVQTKLVGGTALSNVKELVAGSDHSVALKIDGTVWAWGLNSSGQVGNGTVTTPQKNAVQVKVNATTFLTGVLGIAAGNTHSLALKSDGTVWAWGLNSSGQVGNNTTTNQTFAVQVKIAGGAALTGVADIAAGASHTLATKTDGSLWAWGNNANGQLADGTTAPVSTSKKLVATQAKASASTFVTGVRAIAGGASHTLALKIDGTVWAWGLNASGQLGNSSTTQQVFPVQVNNSGGGFLTGVVDLFGGANHSLATRPDGTMWGWGLNSLGQAGGLVTTVNPSSASDIRNGSRPVLIIWALEDPDRDNLLNWQERALGTNINNEDSDFDGMPDDYEVSNSLNPLLDDTAADPDTDGLTNAQERAAGTDPHLGDSDLDTVDDGEDIYPANPHFALKRTPEHTYAVVEVAEGVSFATARLNNLNSVVLALENGGPGPSTRGKSWVWKGGAKTYLFALDDPSSAPPPDDFWDVYYMHAYGINDSDVIAGGSGYPYPTGNLLHYNHVFGAGNVWHAFQGTGRPFKDLSDGCIDNSINDATGTPTPDATHLGQSQAFAINNAGTVVGQADFFVDVDLPQEGVHGYMVNSGASRAARFTGGGGAVDLGVLPGGGTSLALAINESGDIAGYGNHAGTNVMRAIFWKGGNQIVNLGTIPGYPYAGDTYATALNSSQYVVGAQESFQNGQRRRAPFLWHEHIPSGSGGQMMWLPTPWNATDVQVNAINKDGVMVGGSLIWQNGTYSYLNDRRGADAIAAGWSFGGGFDINDHGVILATAWRPGFTGFVLLVPGRILPDDNQRGVTGDLIASNLGSVGQAHYVSPKQVGAFVVLKAVGPESSSDFAASYAWEGDGQEVAGSPDKRQIARDTPGKYQVRLRHIPTNTILDTMNVWIVWALATATENAFGSTAASFPTGDGTSGPGTTLSGGYRYTFTIEPQAITEDPERPDLSGSNLSSPPGGVRTHVINGETLQEGADKKWDCSRQIRVKILNPSLYGTDVLSQLDGFLWAGQPAPITVPEDYPSDSALGNDDTSTTNDLEINDPYTSLGQIFANDIAYASMRHSTGSDGDTFERRMQFIEFLRLNLGGSWFRVSDDHPWRIHFRFKRLGGTWSDDATELTRNNDGF